MESVAVLLPVLSLCQTQLGEFLQRLAFISDGFAASDLEAAVREVVKQAVVKGDGSIADPKQPKKRTGRTVLG